MSDTIKRRNTGSCSRREFLQTGTLSALSTAGGLSIARMAHAGGSSLIRLAFIGCGGRGGGAVTQSAEHVGTGEAGGHGGRVRRPHRGQPQVPEAAWRHSPSHRRTARTAVRGLRRLPEGDRLWRGYGDSDRAAALPAAPLCGGGEGRQARLHGEALGRRRAGRPSPWRRPTPRPRKWV